MLGKICTTPSMLHLLRRGETEQQVYMKRMKEIRSEWESLDEYLRAIAFQYDMIETEVGKKKTRGGIPVGANRRIVEGVRVAVSFRKNDFPYDIAEEIEHWLLWIAVDDENFPANTSSWDLLTENAVSTLLGEYVPGASEYVWCVNPPELRSVACLPHVHIFSRPRPTKTQ